jgi:hypothetical protein
MDIPTLVSRFEAGTLPADAFHHLEHLKVTWFYLGTCGPDRALERMADGLLAFATRMGKADKFDYALTRAWVTAVDDARRAHPEATTFDTLLAARPDLLDRSCVDAWR